MKKYISTLCVLMMLLLSVALPVNASTLQPGTTSGTMELKTARTAEYEVTIPADTHIPFATVNDYQVGEVRAGKMVIAPDKKIVVRVQSQNNKNFVGPNGTLPYVLKMEPIEFKTLHDASVFPIYINIAKEDWHKTPAGEYQDKLTFTLSYENK